MLGKVVRWLIQDNEDDYDDADDDDDYEDDDDDDDEPFSHLSIMMYCHITCIVWINK